MKRRNNRIKEFKIIIEPDEDKWHAFIPALEEQGASTWGNTLSEAFKNLREILYITLRNEEIKVRIKDVFEHPENLISEEEMKKELGWK